MSRAWATCKTTFVSLAMAAVIGGCIFSPAEQPPDITPPPPIDSPQALITALSEAYRTREYSRIEGLFHDDYLFILHPEEQPDPNLPPPPTDWGKTEELRIHRRMFEPQNIPTDEEPLPMDLWLIGVNIALAESQPFELRSEYIQSPTNPDGLPPETWKAWGAEYNTQVLFETQGETDYQVNGTAWFVVVEDLTKTGGAPGRFLLYRWQDLGSRKPSRLTL